MNGQTIRIPNQINSLKAVDNAFRSLNDLEHCEILNFDFRWCQFSEPFALLYLGRRITNIKDEHVALETKILIPKHPTSAFFGYAPHVGFFDFIGSDIGRKMGEAQGSPNYFPIRHWCIEKILSLSNGDPVGAFIDRQAGKIAKILIQEDSGDIFAMVQYAIREIVRNSIEHSKGKSCWFFGQYWPKKNLAEIVVMDDGVGISDTLIDNEYIDVSTNLAGMKLSLFPGVTGVTRAERLEQDDTWGNSGFGLYILSEIFGKFGEFHMISENDYLKINKQGQCHKAYPFRGTGIAIRFPVRALEHARGELDSINSRGEKLRSELLKDFPIKASVASRMLSSHCSKKIKKGQDAIGSLGTL